ncbi:KEOPS complex subunit Cgi121 [Archaeoglobus sp.]
MKVKQGILKINSLEDFLKNLGECVAVIDGRYVIDLDVVKFAVEKALKSWKDGRNIAKTLPLEILLYFCATRQIRDAIKVGVKEGISEAVVVVLKECEDKLEKFFEEKEVVRIDEERIENVKKLYGITDDEIEIVGLEKIALLIRERITLFDVFKS